IGEERPAGHFSTIGAVAEAALEGLALKPVAHSPAEASAGSRVLIHRFLLEAGEYERNEKVQPKLRKRMAAAPYSRVSSSVKPSGMVTSTSEDSSQTMVAPGAIQPLLASSVSAFSPRPCA